MYPHSRNSVLQAYEELLPRVLQPLVLFLEHIGRRVLHRLSPADRLHSWPFNPAGGDSSGAAVAVLTIEWEVHVVPGPLEVPSRLDDISDLRLHDDGVAVVLPWPAEVALDGESVREEEGFGHDSAVLDHEDVVLLRICATLSGDGVLLVGERLADDDESVLNNCKGGAEDEVDGA
eukprot:553303_1